jgi:hypothetical protein
MDNTNRNNVVNMYGQPYRAMPQPIYPTPQNVNKKASSLNEARKVIEKHRPNCKGLKLIPDNIGFATQNPHEKVFVYIRRHAIENLRWVVLNIIYCIFPLLIYIGIQFLNINTDIVSFNKILIILLVYYSLIITNVLKDFFDWYFDPYIITNERVIHFEFKPFSNYKVKEVMLQNIETITEKSSGIIANIFDYGTLSLSIEGPQDDFAFLKIPNPTKVRDILADLTQVAKKYYGDND